MIARLLISQSYNTLTDSIRQMLKEQNLEKKHPDVLYIEKGMKLGIREAKKITEHFSLKPYSAKGRAVTVEDISEMTPEAQNALLKTIEELPRESMLLLCTTSDANLLPTIISRCQIIKLDHTNRDKKTEISRFDSDLQQLLESDIPTRFQYIEKLKEKEEFLHYMAYFFRKQIHQSKTRSAITVFLQEILLSEKWARQNVNIRAILEYLMLVMPRGVC